MDQHTVLDRPANHFACIRSALPLLRFCTMAGLTRMAHRRRCYRTNRNSELRRNQTYHLDRSGLRAKKLFSGSFDLNQRDLQYETIFAECLGDNFT
jgi:hypothetical protein